MDTLTIRIYTQDGKYSSTREITINIEDLRQYITDNHLKSTEELTSFSLEKIS